MRIRSTTFSIVLFLCLFDDKEEDEAEEESLPFRISTKQIISVGKSGEIQHKKTLINISRKKDDDDALSHHPLLLLLLSLCLFLDDDEEENVAFFIIIAQQESLHNW